MEKRVNRLHWFCKKGYHALGHDRPTLIYRDRPKFLYCRINKVASRTMTKFLLRAFGIDGHTITHIQEDSPNYNKFTGLKRFTYYKDYIKHKANFESYFKFLVVRNPYDRLVSAYRDKFGREVQSMAFRSWHKLGRKIIQGFRTDWETPPNNTGTDTPTFSEFLRYVAYTGKLDKQMDDHWAPMYRLCDPCLLNFTAVLKFENFQSELAWIQHRITNKTIKLAHYNKGPGNKTSLLTHRYWKAVPHAITANIHKIFGPDFMAFGYEKIY